MDTAIKTLIESYNTSSLIGEFTTAIMDYLPIIIPIAGGIGIAFFAVKAIRGILHV